MQMDKTARNVYIYIISRPWKTHMYNECVMTCQFRRTDERLIKQLNNIFWGACASHTCARDSGDASERLISGGEFGWFIIFAVVFLFRNNTHLVNAPFAGGWQAAECILCRLVLTWFGEKLRRSGIKTRVDEYMRFWYDRISPRSVETIVVHLAVCGNRILKNAHYIQ